MNRRRLLQLSGAGIATLAAGCTNDGSGSGGSGGTGNASNGSPTVNRNEVHMLTDYNSERWQQRWDEELIPGFEDQTEIPVKAEYSGFQGSGEQRLQTLIQSGNTPEMFYGSLSSMGQIINEGIAVTVDDVIETLEEVHGDILAKQTIGFDDGLYLVPHGVYAGGTFNYREDVYDQLSIEGPPESWDELLNYAEVIDKDGDIDARGYGVPGQKTGKAGSEFQIQLRTNDAHVYRWKNESEGVAEIWFPEDEVVETIEFMDQLAEYSPDPTSLGWANTIKYWVGNRIAQTQMQNGWLAGVAARSGLDTVAKNTQVAKMPTSGGGESEVDRGWLLADGVTILDGDNPEGAKKFIEYAYGTTERAVENHHIEPMRFIPFAKSILESDQYQSADIFQKYDGHLLDLKMKVYEEIMPTLGNRDLPRTRATNYVNRFFTISEMLNRVLVGNETPKSAYEWARDELEEQLKEGQERAQANA